MEASDIPTKFSVAWASGAAGGNSLAVPVTTTSPNLPSLTLGYPPAQLTSLGSGGVPPNGFYENGLNNQITAWLQWISAGGPVTYDATFQTAIGGYPNGALIWSATTPFLQWLCVVDNNMTNPDTGGGGWISYQPVVRNWKSGLSINTTLGNTTFGISPGVAADSTNTVMIPLTNGSFTKTTGSWTQGSGNGALDTGSIAPGSYALFIMEKISTGAVDAIITKAIAGSDPSPSLPSGWTLSRRIGYVEADSLGHIIPVIQRGNEFWYYNALASLDFSGTPPTLSRTLENLSVPLGIICQAIFNLSLFGTGVGGTILWLSDPATADVAPLNGNTPLATIELGVSMTVTQVSNAGQWRCWTNTSGQIGVRGGSTSPPSPIGIQTVGWYDPMGSLS